ncbi:MarR family winged helix-turn-helix transcriptional regulator [Actinomadura namibiensis]|uniref:DNA-binding MarR family transcriptional regulator n=1 Tax=Actinomadura namibiensis TaxID=182080 RepID=A0A7W3LU00_ACTNM|nr:MarR family transcriptional regulator [Actinomadura namibiensis]MBA8954167.1 DNA-binding MarR family transcriptional regulator [Actinomadura namibiensis]
MRAHGTLRGMKSEAELIGQWRSLLTSYNTVACRLDRALQDEHGLTMSEFETLDRLVANERDKCRMQEIAADMYLSQSALSRTVARLEKDGLVERALCEVDRRGVIVVVTEAGRRRHAEARRTHLAVLAEHLAPAEAPATTR